MKAKLLFIVLTFSFLSFAQDGSPDLTFNTNDIGYGNGDGSNKEISGIKEYTDGKILVYGNFNTYHNKNTAGIVKLNSDYSLDNTFSSIAFGPAFNSLNQNNYYVNDIADIIIQNDGKIVILCGLIGSSYSINCRHILRLNSDGSLDSTFNAGTATNGLAIEHHTKINSLQQQADGKIIIAGNFKFYNGLPLFNILRVNTDGSVDNSFNAVADPNGDIQAKIQTDGKILVYGNVLFFNNTSVNGLIRLNTDGSLDPSFTYSGNDYIGYLNLQENGKMIVFGNTTKRINADGSLDTGFNLGCNAIMGGRFYQSYTTSSGNIILVGYFRSCNNINIVKNNLVVLNSDGSLNNLNKTIGSNERIDTIQLINNKLVITGNFQTFDGVSRNKIALINSDATIDTSGIGFGTGVNGTIYKTLVQQDGKILISGTFTAVNGVGKKNFARLNIDGTIDNPFSLGTLISANDKVLSFALQNDGKILVCVVYENRFGGYENQKLVRLNTDGSLDLSFNSNVNCKIIQPQNDGKVLISDGLTVKRLNVDGSIDNSFTSFSLENSYDQKINTIAVQSDGKILVGGQFKVGDGSLLNSLLRLNVNGTIDYTFLTLTGVTGGTFREIKKIIIQPDNKILIGGYFSYYKGVPAPSLIRLASNGVLETGFLPISYGGVEDICLLPNGQIVIAGLFARQQPGGIEKLARLNYDGTSDYSFSASLINGTVFSAARLSDDNLVVGGEFTVYGGVGRNRIAKVINNTVLTTESNYLTNKNDIIISKFDNGVKINSKKIIMKSIQVFDTSGKEILKSDNLNNYEIVLNDINSKNSLLIFKINDNENNYYTIKFIYL